MQLLLANVLNEAEKLIHQKKTRAALLLTIAVPVLSALLLDRLHSNTGVVLISSASFPISMLRLFTSVLLPLFLFMTVAEMFSGEVASRTMKHVLVRPIARAKIFASKVIVIALFILGHLGILWLISVLIGTFLDSTGVLNGFFEGVMGYLAAFAPMLAIGLIAVFISIWVDSSVGSLALCMFIYIAAKLLPFIFPQVATWSAFSYTDWHMMWMGNGATYANLFPVFIFLLSNCIISYTMGWYLFEKKQY